MPCCTQSRGTQGCEIQHKKGDRGVVGCRINLGIYDLLICTSLNLNWSVARVTQLSPPRSNLAAENNWEALHFFFSSLTAGKCSLHYSSECSWGTGAEETEQRERERTRRRMRGERKRGEGQESLLCCRGLYLCPPLPSRSSFSRISF